MSPVEFFTASGVIAWGFLLVTAVRRLRGIVERVRSLRRRLAWALWWHRHGRPPWLPSARLGSRDWWQARDLRGLDRF